MSERSHRRRVVEDPVRERRSFTGAAVVAAMDPERELATGPVR